jgi:hypothetical protein
MMSAEVVSRSVFSAAVLTTLLVAAVAGSQSAGAPAPAGGVTDSDAVFQIFKGARLGMKAEEVRKILGRPQEKDDAQDFYVLSETHRIRVYYGADGGATALVASFVGEGSGAPTPEAILGGPAEPTANGSASGSALRPEKGYRVSYSRTAADTPMVFITVQKL